MASASSSSAKNLFSESKRRLADRVSGNVNSAASVARQIVRGSRSNEVSCDNNLSINRFQYCDLSCISLSITAFASRCQKFCTTGVNDRKFIPKSEKNGIAASAHGLPMWFHCGKFEKIGLFKGASGSDGKIDWIVIGCILCDKHSVFKLLDVANDLRDVAGCTSISLNDPND